MGNNSNKQTSTFNGCSNKTIWMKPNQIVSQIRLVVIWYSKGNEAGIKDGCECQGAANEFVKTKMQDNVRWLGVARTRMYNRWICKDENAGQQCLWWRRNSRAPREYTICLITDKASSQYANSYNSPIPLLHSYTSTIHTIAPLNTSMILQFIQYEYNGPVDCKINIFYIFCRTMEYTFSLSC